MLTNRKEWYRPCLDPFFSSLNFRHSISVTYHSSLITLKYHTHLAPSLTCHHSIFFTLFVGPTPDTLTAPNSSLCLSFFFSFFPFVFLCLPWTFLCFLFGNPSFFCPFVFGIFFIYYICSLSCIDQWTGFETTCSSTVVDGFPWWPLIGGFGGAMGLWCCCWSVAVTDEEQRGVSQTQRERQKKKKKRR